MTAPGYIHGHPEVVVGAHARRTVEEAAAFVLPRVAEDMDILDLGCGPGSITAGWARVVGKGTVVGLDPARDVLPAAAQRLAGAGNAALLAADVYSLPFAHGSFDVVYAHQVLQHVADPVGALRAARRVLRPGGLMAVRDADYGTMVHAPHDPLLDRWREVYTLTARALGGEPDAGRYLLGWVLAAGLAHPVVTTTTWTYADAAGRREWGETWAGRVLSQPFAANAIRLAGATQEELEEISLAWRRWVGCDDGYFSFIHTEVVAVEPTAGVPV